MNITVTSRVNIETVEILTLGRGGKPTITHKDISESRHLTSASTPSVAQISEFQVALSGGSATVDLLNLIGTQGQTLAATGLKIQKIKVTNANGNALQIAPAGSNGYGLSMTVPPQGIGYIESASLMAAIGSTAHCLSLTGTGAQVSSWTIILG